MKGPGRLSGDLVIDHIGQQMQGRIVGEVGGGHDVFNVLPRHAFDPRIVDDVGDVIQMEESKT